jgi:hypothetical protein
MDDQPYELETRAPGSIILGSPVAGAIMDTVV